MAVHPSPGAHNSCGQCAHEDGRKLAAKFSINLFELILFEPDNGSRTSIGFERFHISP